MVSNKHPERRFDKFKMAMVNEAGFRQSSCDHSWFVRYTASGMVILLVYVDNIMKPGDDILGISSLKSHLQKQFRMKDLGYLRYFIGIEVLETSRGYIHHEPTEALELICSIYRHILLTIL